MDAGKKEEAVKRWWPHLTNCTPTPLRGDETWFSPHLRMYYYCGSM